MIDRFDHVLIRPADFGRSLAFYRDTLGWSVIAQWGEGSEPRCAVLSGGAIKLILLEGGAGDGRMELRLDIHDVERRFREVPDGAHVATRPGESADGVREFVLVDPDGNRIAFEEVHRARG